MEGITLKNNGQGAIDNIKREEAFKTLNEFGSTEALTLLSEMVKKPGANEKFVKNASLLKKFI
ncbi:hypothetical protein [uncultured Tenacibaculum sp.]|uniref:hypothetical protein n=1 Tax=uncultured Tenacibaculum sp. TaxID=174713 RepID=UPI0026072129|nr:hypothetical protein [uncultured Tenacibaculum sp.]